jgi:hypothetical protein
MHKFILEEFRPIPMEITPDELQARYDQQLQKSVSQDKYHSYYKRKEESEFY